MTQVTRKRRLAQVVLSVFFNLTCAGVIFGFAALKPILVREGVYSDLCKGKHPGHGRPCDQQDLRMNYMFTLSTVITNVAALPVGALLDRIGPKYTSLLGAAVFGAGNIVFPLGYREGLIDTYFVGFICLAIGGPLIFLSSFHLSNTFPARAGLILSCVTGAFDASSVPYLLYDVLYDRAGPISLKGFFWSYAIIPALLVVFQVTIAPAASYQRDEFKQEEGRHHERDTTGTVTQDEDEETPTTAVGSGMEDDSLARGLEANLAAGDKGLDSRDRVIGVMFDRSLSQQIFSTWFYAVVFFLCIYMSRINYLIQTVFSQLLFFLDDVGLARSITTAFTVLLPLGGIVGIPFVGYLLDKRTTFEASLVVLVSGVAYGALGLVPHVGAQIASIAIFVLLRPLMYTFVGDYCGKVFGFNTFGTVYGLTNSISGIFGMVLRPIDVWVKTTLGGDYIPVDVVGLSVGLVASGLLSWKLWRGSRAVRLQ